MYDDENPADEACPEFEDLLVAHLELIEQGERVDREELFRRHPRFAASICEFLDNQQLLHDALGVPIDSVQPDSKRMSAPEEAAASATTAPVPLQRTRDSSWSFARLTEAQFPVQFGEYLLLREIDRGGMGVVFQARHTRLDRLVALKIMRSGELANEEELQRFRAEAESSAAINHPNIVPIYEVGEVHGLVYFTMAFIEGEDLKSLAERQRILPKEAAKIVARVTDAVSAAHRCGVIHRDLKPSNILLDVSGEPFLIDFGLAKKARSDNQALTRTGQILGTPAYMAPEQAKGDQPTPASDIYSLGAVLYELTAGQPPFSGPTAVDVLLQVLNRDPATPRKVDKRTPRQLECIINRAMAKDAGDRYSSAEQLMADLQRFILDEAIELPRPTLWERAATWWRREPVLVSHLYAISAVLLIVLAASLVRGTNQPLLPLKILLLGGWVVASVAFQRLSIVEKFQSQMHWLWAGFDVAIYTTLMYFADPPRGLLLIGYPMMVAASGLFYRVRFVAFVTVSCIAGFLVLSALVDDPTTSRPDFCIIYISGLAVIGLCLLSMIRRVRGLADYFADGT